MKKSLLALTGFALGMNQGAAALTMADTCRRERDEQGAHVKKAGCMIEAPGASGTISQGTAKKAAPAKKHAEMGEGAQGYKATTAVTMTDDTTSAGTGLLQWSSRDGGEGCYVRVLKPSQADLPPPQYKNKLQEWR